MVKILKNGEQAEWYAECHQELRELKTLFLTLPGKDFHVELLKRFGKLLDERRSDDEIKNWFEIIPSEYWTYSMENILPFNSIKKNVEVTEYLVSDVHKESNCKNCRKKSLLDLATKKGDSKIIKFLLNAGALYRIHKYKDNSGPLHIAAKSADLNEVKKLIFEDGAEVNAIDGKLRTPLHVVAEIEKYEYKKEYEDIVRILVDAGAEIDAVDREEDTALHLAIRRNHETIASDLLNAGANSDLKNKNRTTPLHLAAGRNLLDLANRLIDLGADINAFDLKFNRALSFAIANGDHKMAKLLVDYGASTVFLESDRSCLLLGPIKHNNIELVKFLLSLAFGKDLANAREPSKEGLTCLQVAAVYRRKEILLELLKRGADVRIMSNEEKDLLYYVARPNCCSTRLDRGEYLDFLKWFISLELDQKLNDDLSNNINERWMRHWLVRNTNAEVLQLLEQERGLILTGFTDAEYYDLFSEALSHEHDASAFKYIFKKTFFDVNKLFPYQYRGTEQQETLLHDAVSYDNLSATNFLLKNGADTEVKDSYGLTPLHYGVRTKSVECVWLLLMFNANTETLDGQEETSIFSEAVSKSNDSDGEKEKAIVYNFLAHFALLDVSKKPVKEENSRIIQEFDYLQEGYDAHKNELTALQECFVCESVSCFDILVNPKRYVRNPHVFRTIIQQDISEKFKDYYRNRLLITCGKMLKRLKLMEMATVGLKKILNIESDAFYHIFLDILEYLPNRDLRSLIIA